MEEMTESVHNEAPTVEKLPPSCSAEHTCGEHVAPIVCSIEERHISPLGEGAVSEADWGSGSPVQGELSAKLTEGLLQTPDTAQAQKVAAEGGGALRRSAPSRGALPVQGRVACDSMPGGLSAEADEITQDNTMATTPQAFCSAKTQLPLHRGAEQGSHNPEAPTPGTGEQLAERLAEEYLELRRFLPTVGEWSGLPTAVIREAAETGRHLLDVYLRHDYRERQRVEAETAAQAAASAASVGSMVSAPADEPSAAERAMLQGLWRR